MAQVAVQNPEGKVLASVVKQGTYWGQVVFPGGTIEPDKKPTVEQARQELSEEAGIISDLHTLHYWFEKEVMTDSGKLYQLTAFRLLLASPLEVGALAYEDDKKTAWFWIWPRELFDLGEYNLLLPTTQVILEALIDRNSE